MHEPSNAISPSKARSSSPMGTATFFVTPWMSSNCKRTSRTSSSLARRTTSRLLMWLLVGVHGSDRQRRPDGKLILRRFQVDFQDLRYLVEAIEDGVAVHREPFRGFLDVLANFEVELQRLQQVGL